MKGNAMPSLHPDSAERTSRRCLGTRLANLPLPTTDEARTGSVAVTQAAMHKDSSHDNGIIIHQMKRLVMSQPNVMTGTRRNTTDFQCRSMYDFGSSTPTAKHCTTRTMRENSRVIWSVLPQVVGLIKFAACGPKMTPQMVATVASPMYSFSLMNREHNMKMLVKPPRIM